MTTRTSSSGLISALVGRVVEIGKAFQPGQPAWPVNEPNASGEHLATIEATWVDKDGNLAALFVTPNGTAFEGWVNHHRLTPKKK